MEQSGCKIMDTSLWVWVTHNLQCVHGLQQHRAWFDLKVSKLTEALLDEKHKNCASLQSNKNTWLNSIRNSTKDVGMKATSHSLSLSRRDFGRYYIYIRIYIYIIIYIYILLDVRRGAWLASSSISAGTCVPKQLIAGSMSTTSETDSSSPSPDSIAQQLFRYQIWTYGAGDLQGYNEL